MGAPRKQPRTIRALERLAQAHCYTPSLRSLDSKHSAGDKRFYPDLIADPNRGSVRRFFEVEQTVTNNTVFKSLASLLHFLATNPGEGYLVVPARSVEFAEGCLSEMIQLIRAFGKKAKGANRKIRVSVLSFGNIEADETKLLAWQQSARRRRPPRCPYLPNPYHVTSKRRRTA